MCRESDGQILSSKKRQKKAETIQGSKVIKVYGPISYARRATS